MLYGDVLSGYLASNLPDLVLELIFSYLSLRDIRQCMTVCRHWHRYLSDENNDIWRTHCQQKLSEEVIKSELLSALPTYRSKLRAFYHSWNPNDCSRNVYIKPNGFTLHRNPVAQSTDGSRGKIGFREGRHAWEVMWEGPLGTVAVVGVATNTSSIQCHGYVALLGERRLIGRLGANSLILVSDSIQVPTNRVGVGTW